MSVAADDVNRKRWRDKIVLFDNGEYSVIEATYRLDSGEWQRENIGQRWNGSTPESMGFPSVRGFPLWHNTPAFLCLPVFRAILAELQENPGDQQGENVASRVALVKARIDRYEAEE